MARNTPSLSPRHRTLSPTHPLSSLSNHLHSLTSFPSILPRFNPHFLFSIIVYLFLLFVSYLVLFFGGDRVIYINVAITKCPEFRNATPRFRQQHLLVFFFCKFLSRNLRCMRHGQWAAYSVHTYHSLPVTSHNFNNSNSQTPIFR